MYKASIITSTHDEGVMQNYLAPQALHKYIVGQNGPAFWRGCDLNEENGDAQKSPSMGRLECATLTIVSGQAFERDKTEEERKSRARKQKNLGG